MTQNHWAMQRLKDSLRYGLGLTDKDVNAIAERLEQTYKSNRLVVLPTYLTDEMYDAQTMIDGQLSYQKANKSWTAAIDSYTHASRSYKKPREPDRFW